MPISTFAQAPLRRRFRWIRLLSLVGGFMLPSVAQPQPSPTIPTFHWVYTYLDELHLRQPGLDFDPARLPLTALEIDSLRRMMAGSRGSSGERFWYRRIKEYGAHFGRPGMASAGFLLQEKLGRFASDELRSRLALRPQLTLAVNRRLLLFNSIRLDQELNDDPAYLGKKWRQFSGYTEQAYAMWRFGRGALKFGRDFVVWGRGHDASLLLSDAARPLDLISFDLAMGRLRFSYVVAKLDAVEVPDSLRSTLGAATAPRYVAANRWSYSFLHNKLRLAISQAVLYGGPGQQIEWSFLNPFIFLHGEVLNGPVDANSFGSVEIVVRPQPRLEFYGHLLVDDVQIEKTGAGDLEPSEIGYMAGGRIADPLGFGATTFGLEYTRVANRTYNSPDEFTKFLHRRQPLGHFLGNDFDRWLIFGSGYLGGALALNWELELRRRGEGRIDAPFDTPWIHSTLTKGYAEKFPGGVVEKGLLTRVELRWHPRTSVMLSLCLGHSRFDDYKNLSGIKKNISEIYLRGWFEFDTFLHAD